MVIGMVTELFRPSEGISDVIKGIKAKIRDHALVVDLSVLVSGLELKIYPEDGYLIFTFEKGCEKPKTTKAPIEYVKLHGEVPGTTYTDLSEHLMSYCDDLTFADVHLIVERIEGLVVKCKDYVLKERKSDVEEKSKEKFEVKTLSEIIMEAKPIEFLVDRLIPKRSLIVIAGKGGVGKSTTVLKIVHDLVSRKSVFGEFTTNGAEKVLIIDEENYKSFYQHRCQLLGIDNTEGIHACIMQGAKLDTEEGMLFLEEKVKEGFDVVVLDSWSNLVVRTDENKAVEVTKVLNKLRRLAYEHDCTFIMIHHLRKNLPYVVEDIDELRGSSALVNEPDLVYIFQQDKSTGSVIVKCVKNRFGEPISFRLAFEEDEDGKLSITFKGFIETVEVETQVVHCAKVVVEFLRLRGEARWKEIVNAIEFSETTIKRTLKYLESIGVIERPKRGIYRLTPQRQLSDFGSSNQNVQSGQNGHSITYNDQTDQTLNTQSKTHDDEDTRNGQNVQHILYYDHSDHNQTNYTTNNNIKKDERKTYVCPCGFETTSEEEFTRHASQCEIFQAEQSKEAKRRSEEDDQK